MKPKLRSRSRAAALQILYEIDLGAEPEAAFASVMGHFGTPPLDNGYLRRILDGVESRRDELIEGLSKVTSGWSRDRQDVVDRSLLLMGGLELLEGSAPLKVVLSEAGALAERYGSERSANFVRATLDRFAQGLQS